MNNPNILNAYENSMVMGTDGLYDTNDNMLRQEAVPLPGGDRIEIDGDDGLRS